MQVTTFRTGWLVTVMTILAPPAMGESPLIRSGERVVFLGDSITAAGHYIAMLDEQFFLAGNLHSVELINLGLPSETCSGLSEPDHPFPRPDVHERLDRALAKTQPDVVVACYGMNDGIYHPFSEVRFAAYRRGIDKLIEKVQTAQARLILLTPPPFDPLPIRRQGKLQSAGANIYGWTAVYENYDDVLARYAEYIQQQRPRVHAVIDVRTPILQHLQARRDDDPDYQMSHDGVHINREGHAVMARAIASGLRLRWHENGAAIEDVTRHVYKRQEVLHLAWLSDVGHKRPGIAKGLPLDEAYRAAFALERTIVNSLAEAGVRQPYRESNNPLAPIDDDPALPRVLLIGDSISIGYTLPVRELLAGKANVHRPPTNGGSTLKGLAQLDRWLGDRQWDVIHFNWGLHDLKYLGPRGENLADPSADGSRQMVPIDQYGENLDQLIERLKATGAQLIWCSTTPVPKGARGRVPGDAARYNQIGNQLANNHEVAINDLYAFAAERLPEIQQPANVHFTPAGSRELAKQVAAQILAALRGP